MDKRLKESQRELSCLVVEYVTRKRVEVEGSKETKNHEINGLYL